MTMYRHCAWWRPRKRRAPWRWASGPPPRRQRSRHRVSASPSRPPATPWPTEGRRNRRRLGPSDPGAAPAIATSAAAARRTPRTSPTQGPHGRGRSGTSGLTRPRAWRCPRSGIGPASACQASSPSPPGDSARSRRCRPGPRRLQEDRKRIWTPTRRRRSRGRRWSSRSCPAEALARCGPCRADRSHGATRARSPRGSPCALRVRRARRFRSSSTPRPAGAGVQRLGRRRMAAREWF
mmetsp:Transcript_67564/g.195340  ORF Transcript_67564/g.195340 Transcript_67564/m.195340 type:complete len:237 (-) Transcript_67564:441-1151(-)